MFTREGNANEHGVKEQTDLFVGHRGWMHKEVTSNGEIKEFRSDTTGNVHIHRSLHKETFGY